MHVLFGSNILWSLIYPGDILRDSGYRNSTWRHGMRLGPKNVGAWCSCTGLQCIEPIHGFVNSLRPRQNGRHFADDVFKCNFLNENFWIPIKISLKFVPKGPINNILALFQEMAWRRSGDKPLSEPMMVSLPTHICVTRPQWVNCSFNHTGRPKIC